MGWLNDPLPNWIQWLGFFATVVGTAISVIAAAAAVRAARNAKSASEQANEAKLQAVRLGRVLQLSDLLSDVQELQILLARMDFEAIGAKASHLRGRVVRFKSESYNLLDEQHVAGLDRARDQLETIGRTAASRRGEDEGRIGRIQIALAVVNEVLNQAYAVHHAGVLGSQR
jgi:hypothetical protein